MNVVLFDGKKFAAQNKKVLKEKVQELKKRRITPKLVSILIGHDAGSKLYLSLKREAAKRVGVGLQVQEFSADVNLQEIVSFIQKLNKDENVHGIMVQLPLPKNFSEKQRDEIVKAIVEEKDVDGMREGSPFLTPTVKAVVLAIKEAGRNILLAENVKVLVFGSEGFVGKRLMKVLGEMGYNIDGVDVDRGDIRKRTKKADILISVTGKPGLIKKDMVKDGVVVIDIGAPRADVEKGVYKKASFITPVPGGIGPVTIACLLENLVSAC